MTGFVYSWVPKLFEQMVEHGDVCVVQFVLFYNISIVENKFYGDVVSVVVRTYFKYRRSDIESVIDFNARQIIFVDFHFQSIPMINF